MTQDLRPHDISQFQTWKHHIPLASKCFPCPAAQLIIKGSRNLDFELDLGKNRHLWATPAVPARGIISPRHVEAQPAATRSLTAVGQHDTCDTSQLWARGARLEGANKPCHIPHPSPGTGPHLAVPAVFFLSHGTSPRT